MNKETLEKVLRQAAERLKDTPDGPHATDIHIQAFPATGELRVLDDDDNVLARCEADAWNGDEEADPYTAIADCARSVLQDIQDEMERFNVLKPYSFILIDESGETVADLLLVDDDLLVLDSELMAGLDAELDAFWEELAGSVS
ncbi:MAG: hypothetical protein IJ722_03045 [Alloprevotella sp.]|nr:hypothetical protein [Alloprevotella sp.]